jgi:hydrogenase nickel insertion protein HypA
MHEYSLVSRLLEQVTQLAAQNAVTNGEATARVTEVCLQIGPLSGVESLLLQSAFARLSPGTVAADARLQVDKVPLLVRCDACGQQSELPELRFVCPTCMATNLKVLNGEGVVLKSIALAIPQDATHTEKAMT